MKLRFPQVTSLRDVSPAMLEECRKNLDPLIYRRCKYVVEENDRLVQACGVLEKRDLKSFGAFMNKTHQGLSQEYEVSCRELDFLAHTVRDIPEVYGARMMGGGFGGCTINLIENHSVAEINRHVSDLYTKKFKTTLKTYISRIDSGTQIIS